jgi:4-hydroxy-3-methylbut-2-enyl diphosphate reductase
MILAKPRGFCAGVERAIRSVERALELYGPPVYVLNAIVHNNTVVDHLRDKGAVFVRRLQDVPEGSHVLFSAHGVGPDQWETAARRQLNVIDATCPLVERVHRDAKHYADLGYTVILIGEQGHDEVVGTAGWARGHIEVVMTALDVERLRVDSDSKLVYLAQTTLSVEAWRRVVDALERRFPWIEAPTAAGICYATQNRQRAVTDLVPEAGLVLIVGDFQSANSKRLAEICRKKGKVSYLIPSASGISLDWFAGVETVLVSSGASVPEDLVQGVVERLKTLGYTSIEEREVVHEDVHFKLPDSVRGSE